MTSFCSSLNLSFLVFFAWAAAGVDAAAEAAENVEAAAFLFALIVGGTLLAKARVRLVEVDDSLFHAATCAQLNQNFLLFLNVFFFFFLPLFPLSFFLFFFFFSVAQLILCLFRPAQTAK
jgi:hypothetical protein